MLIDSPDWDDYPNDWLGLHLYEPAKIIRNDDNNILTIRMRILIWNAYSNMMSSFDKPYDQSIIISGESGTGRYIYYYL